MVDKKKIVIRLNEMFNNYDELSTFCNYLSNDVNKVVDKINKIIKYAFINENFISNKFSINYLLYEVDKIDIDSMYNKYLRKINLFYLGKSNKNNESNISIKLDSDIRLKDLENLSIPSLSELENICKDNIKKKGQQSKKIDFYKEQMNFTETEFTYTRLELVTINPSFIYYNSSLSGNIDKDFKLLYEDDRYGNNPLSPLNNSYYDNIEKIKKQSDIKINKYGNLHDIENGRHRIIYILKNAKEVTIPVKMTRRIEDREFNIILGKLKEKYQVSIYKNNLLNDEYNILIIVNGNMYDIKNKDELISFYNKLNEGTLTNEFNCISFKIIETEDKIKIRQIIEMYKKIIFQKYIELGEKLLNNNFSEIIKYFDNSNNSLFYESFRLVQSDYQESKILGYNFDEKYRLNDERISEGISLKSKNR